MKKATVWKITKKSEASRSISVTPQNVPELLTYKVQLSKIRLLTWRRLDSVRGYLTYPVFEGDILSSVPAITNEEEGSPDENHTVCAAAVTFIPDFPRPAYKSTKRNLQRNIPDAEAQARDRPVAKMG